MTLAICIACGDEKIGAWDLCPACRFTPESDEDRESSLSLSDWFIPRGSEEWENARKQIKSGVKPWLDQSQQASSQAGFRIADADNPTNGYATLEAFQKANPALSIDQAEAIWDYMSPFIGTATTKAFSGTADLVYAAFVVQATGPAEKLQEWVSSCRGYMYPINGTQKPAGTYVMIFPGGGRPPSPSRDEGVRIMSMQQVGPP
jgi:hypothetical protein